MEKYRVSRSKVFPGRWCVEKRVFIFWVHSDMYDDLCARDAKRFCRELTYAWEHRHGE